MPNLKSINRGAAKGIGIDFTPDSAQTISLERKGGHLRITNVSSFPYEQDADGAATVFPAALKRHIKTEGVQLAGVSLTSLGSNETIHDIPNTLPDTDRLTDLRVSEPPPVIVSMLAGSITSR